MKLIQELFARAILNEKQKDYFEKEISVSNKTEEELILENNLLPENDLFEIKSKILNIPLKDVAPDDVDVETLGAISEEAILNYNIIPIFKKEKFIEIGTPYPENMSAQNAIRFLARQEKFEYKISLITINSFKNLLRQKNNLKGEAKKALEEIEIIKKSKKQDTLEEKLDSQIVAEEAPVVKMVLVILRHAIENKASDIHIEPSREKLNVRFRKDGILKSSLFLPLSVGLPITTRIKIVAGLKIDETRVPQDGRFSASIEGKNVDFRVATFPTLYGEKIVIRILDASVGLRSFEDMGIRGRNLEIIKKAIKKPYGLILATGPTGSGKSTTLYSLLNILNQEGVNIVTLEDPVEYSVDGVNQSQVKPEIGYSFASGLRQILRQDPNIIMVGEIRDEETAGLAINAALTGHIVLSTLHTNSSSGVAPRLIDMGIKPFLIPSTLRVAISQRLARTLCKNCKIKVKPTEKIKKYILEKIKDMPSKVKEEIKNISDISIYQAKGCDFCGNSGYLGRIGIYEVLEITEELSEIILKNPTEIQILKMARKQGMLTMEEEGILKVLNGETTIEEIHRLTEEK